MPGLKDLFAGLGKGAVSGVLDGASKIISNFVADPTKKLEAEKALTELRLNAEIKLTEMANEVEKAYLADTQDARSTYARVQESDKASWLAKNIMPILTITVTLGFFGLLGYMLKYSVPESNERIMDILLGSLGTAWITMVSFYFGSSKGSEDKQKHIVAMQNKG